MHRVTGCLASPMGRVKRISESHRTSPAGPLLAAAHGATNTLSAAPSDTASAVLDLRIGKATFPEPPPALGAAFEHSLT